MKYQDAAKQKAKEAKDFAAMRSEVLGMQRICEGLNSPIVFAHNDLLSGNVMIPLEVSLSLHSIAWSCMQACATINSCCRAPQPPP